jgi:CubicO group peptidase (beta-lactamase class C family)
MTISDKYKWGGGGLYSTANDCLRLLHSLLSCDGVLLKSTTILEMLAPQIPNTRIFEDMPPKSVAKSFSSKRRIAGILQHGLCAFMGSEKSELGRSRNSSKWCGLTNTYWAIYPVLGSLVVAGYRQGSSRRIYGTSLASSRFWSH